MFTALREYAYRLLRRSERFTKTDMVYLTKGSFWLILDQAITAVFGIGLAVAFANLMPQELYGMYKYVLSVAAIIGTFALSGLQTAVTRAVAQGSPGVLSSAYSTYLRWSILVVIGGIGGGTYYVLNENSVLAISLFAIAFLQPLIGASGLYAAYFDGKKDFATRAKYSLVRNVGTTVILITALLLTNSILTIILTYFVAHALITLCLYLTTIHVYKLTASDEKAHLDFGKKLSAINILSSFGGQIDSIFIFTIIGAQELAVYSFAVAIPRYINGIFKNIYVLGLPKFAQQSAHTLQKTIFGRSLFLVCISLVFFVIYYFSAPAIYSVLFPQYTEAVPFSQLFALSILFIASGVLLATYFDAIGDARSRLIVAIMTNVSRLILIPLFGIWFGIWGIIFAHLGSQVITLITSILLILGHKKTATS